MMPSIIQQVEKDLGNLYMTYHVIKPDCFGHCWFHNWTEVEYFLGWETDPDDKHNVLLILNFSAS